ncbi:MAG: phosphoribosylaminoimidazolesuccinocarboxamide synthase [Desulfonatronovibrionaceae bacterium]
MQVVTKTRIGEAKLLSAGKVRDIYELDKEQLLIVTTDRMSAFDVVLPDPIPYKGVVLNQMTLFWMDMFSDLGENHILHADFSQFPDYLGKYEDQLRGRSVIVRKTKPLPVECIVRGYISGSGWKDYQRSGKVCGHELPPGLIQSQKLEKPLFTPSTKAGVGEHDENITGHQAKSLVGEGLFRLVEDLSLQMYSRARDYAAKRGIIIADTKFEFGLAGGKMYIIDEVLTPDSSRFWPAESYEPGRPQSSFDKQYLRDWLESSGWDKTAPAPSLPQEVIDETKNKYFQAYKLLTGKEPEID